MRILVACEFSGVVRDAFISQGHYAMSCDIEPSETPGPHYQGDVRDILNDRWDLMIGHPPCTYLANSGVQHLHTDPGRWEKMESAKEFFLLLLNSDIHRICIENPVPHRYAKLPPYSQIVQPYYFGEEAQKKTCLWLRNLPKLQSTNVVGKGELYIGADGKSNGAAWYQLPPGPERAKNRSRTFQSIAQAMATQWGDPNMYGPVQSSILQFA